MQSRLRLFNRHSRFAFSGLSLVRQEYDTDESFLKAFWSLIVLASDSNPLPQIVPKVGRVRVQSLTMTHHQLCRFVALVLMKTNSPGLGSLANSNSKVAAAKICALLKFTTESCADVPEGCVTFRLLRHSTAKMNSMRFGGREKIGSSTEPKWFKRSIQPRSEWPPRSSGAPPAWEVGFFKKPQCMRKIWSSSSHRNCSWSTSSPKVGRIRDHLGLLRSPVLPFLKKRRPTTRHEADG